MLVVSSSGKVAYNAAGMIKDDVATAIRDDIVDATVLLKVCS